MKESKNMLISAPDTHLADQILLFLVPLKILYLEIFGANLCVNLMITDFCYPLSEQFLLTLAYIAQCTKLSFRFAPYHIHH